MRRLAAAVLTLAVVAAAGGDAGARQTYCQKRVQSEHGKVVSKQSGVTVYRSGQIYSVCSDAKRWATSVLVADPGVKPALIRAANKRCVAIVFTRPKQLPDLAVKDLAEKNTLSYHQIIGYGNPSAAVGSLAVSSNCASAWGVSISDGSGSTSYSIQAKGFGTATSLPASVTQVAVVNAAADTRHVGIAAAGKRVTVKWTEAGVAKQATLP
jgi:hypothetical protein